MSAEDLLESIRRRPFVPFRLVTSDGTGYDIRHPELLMPGRRTVTVGIPDNPTVPVYERQVRVALLHVQRLEPLEGELPATGNGAAS